jgi:uncharacterized protein
MERSQHSYILEGIVSTLSQSDELNIAPMGPELPEAVRYPIQTLIIKPFHDSTTYRNLVARGVGVFHLIDDIELIAHAALGRRLARTQTAPCEFIHGTILVDACSWFAFRVQACEDDGPRARFICDVVGSRDQRPFLGFNRAQNALLELTIVATRLHLLPKADVMSELERTIRIVGKTGGTIEHQTLGFLRDRIQEFHG